MNPETRAGDDRWPTWAVALLVLLLVIGSWLVIDTQDKDPSGPWFLGRVLRVFLLGGVVCALQRRSHSIRTIGLILLLWIPCFTATLVTFVFLIGAPVTGGVGSSGLGTFLAIFAAIGLAEATAISVWGLPWLGRLIWGRRRDHAHS